MRRIAACVVACLVLSLCAREPRDPNDALHAMIAAIRSTTMRYDFDLAATGSMRSEVRGVRGRVVVAAEPYRIRTEATRAAMPGETSAPGPMTLVTDGTVVRLLDPSKQTLFTAPMYQAGGLLVKSRTMYTAYPYFDVRFLDEQASKRAFASGGTVEVDGTRCDVVHLDDVDAKQRLEIAIGSDDHLPHRVRWISIDAKKPGVATLSMAHVRTDPPLSARDLAIDAPPSFARREFTLGGPAIGDPARAFQIASVTPESLRGRIVLLDFWATWCGPCRESMPALQQIHERFGPRGVTVVGATWNDTGDVAAFAKANGITYPHGAGDAFASEWGIDRSGIPAMFLIDRDGRIADYFIGWNGTATRDRLVARIELLLASR